MEFTTIDRGSEPSIDDVRYSLTTVNEEKQTYLLNASLEFYGRIFTVDYSFSHEAANFNVSFDDYFNYIKEHASEELFRQAFQYTQDLNDSLRYYGNYSFHELSYVRTPADVSLLNSNKTQKKKVNWKKEGF